jgi:hypothetical protein
MVGLARERGFRTRKFWWVGEGMGQGEEGWGWVGRGYKWMLVW